MFRSQIQNQHYTDEDMMTVVDNSLRHILRRHVQVLTDSLNTQHTLCQNHPLGEEPQPMLQNVLLHVACNYTFLPERKPPNPQNAK